MAPRMNSMSQEHPEIGREIDGQEKTCTTASARGMERGMEADADGEGMIPFRTSKRLQGAIYRMIQERENGSCNAPAKVKQNSSLGPSSTRSLKRQHSPPDRIEVNKGSPVACEDENGANCTLEEMSCRKKKANKCKVHFADPLFVYIEDRVDPVSPSSSILLPDSENDQDFQPRKVQRKVHQTGKPGLPPTDPKDNVNQHKQQPLSCFDLLCNYVGPRGWRCYRSTLEVKSFCSYHQNRTAPSIDRHSGIARAVCT